MIRTKDIEWTKVESEYEVNSAFEYPVENGIIGKLIFTIFAQRGMYFMKANNNNWTQDNIEGLKEIARQYVHELAVDLVVDEDVEAEKKSKKMREAIDWLKTDEGNKSIEEFFDKIEANNKLLLEKKEQYDILSDDDFKNIVIEESKKHDEEWKDKCYKEGCEPYPQEKLSDIINIMLEYGVDYEPGEWGMFESVHRIYKGLRVVRLDGQGSFFRIFDKETLLIQT
jgi:hypothetical protein